MPIPLPQIELDKIENFLYLAAGKPVCQAFGGTKHIYTDLWPDLFAQPWY